MANWAATFPHLPSFDAFMSQLSTTTLALHRQTPAERDAHEQALAWLLEHDLVIQIHTYIRVFASAKVKTVARQRHVEAHMARLDPTGSGRRRRRVEDKVRGSDRECELRCRGTHMFSRDADQVGLALSAQQCRQSLARL